MNISQTFCVFYNLESFEQHWSDTGILYDVPLLEFVVFLETMIMDFLEEDHSHKFAFLSHHIQAAYYEHDL